MRQRRARLSVSVPAELASKIRKAAARDLTAVSAWLAEAAESKLELVNARKAVREYEKQHGEISEQELGRVERAWKQ
ncbi:MAG TPA: hypothetical protein VF395_21185 [Polyangiaceae bacterium]